MSRTDLMALNPDALEGFVQNLGWPRYRTGQMLKWLYQKRVTRFSEMTNLSQSDRSHLEDRAMISRLEVIRHLRSSDDTEKFLLRLSDSQEVETVLIPGEEAKASQHRPRLTLCISTQVGCTLDCSFCLTGRMGLLRNLTAHEIVGQVLEAKRSGFPITNLVLMGMGEPLANYSEVVEALRRLTDPRMVGLSSRRITLSTAGLVPQIKQLGESGIPVNLAISLNATTDAVRDRIMPAMNRLYPLKKLMEACRNYPLPPRGRLTIEYVLLSQVNDTEADAHRLVKLLNGVRCMVNLIPFNEFPGAPFQRPSDEAIFKFQEILIRKGIQTYVRKSRGRDILAACGQLRTAKSSSA